MSSVSISSALAVPNLRPIPSSAKSASPASGCNAARFQKRELESISGSASSSCRGDFRGRVSRAVGALSCRYSAECRGGAALQLMRRREFVGVISSWVALLGLVSAGSAVGAAAAEDDEKAPESSTAAAPPAKTLIERLVERSKANKAKYDKERLDAYYRRNFKDYFGFLKGSILNKDEDTLTEAEKGILRWLEKNQ